MDNQIKKFEKLMQDGYEKTMEGNDIVACDLWQRAWREFLQIIEKEGITSIEEFDNKYDLAEFVSNWIQDYEMVLGNAGVEDKNF